MKYKNLDQIISILCSNSDKLLVSIAGASGAGKSYYAGLLAQKTSSLIITMDDYYNIRSKQIKDKNGDYLYDMPESFEIPLLYSHLELLKKGLSIDKPQYVYHQTKEGRLEQTVRVIAQNHIILDGLYAFYGKLQDISDIKIFIERDIQERLHSRLIRDKLQRNTPVEKSKKIFELHAEPCYQKYGIKQKQYADFILMNNYSIEY